MDKHFSVRETKTTLFGSRQRKAAPRLFALSTAKEGMDLGSVIKKRRKKMRKHKHKKLLAKSRHKRK
jgi:hypothetical protein